MIRYQTERAFAVPPEAVWPHVRQTDWLNQAAGLPYVKYNITPRSEGGSQVMAEATIGGVTVRWRECPFEWREPEFYSVRRVFEGGPIAWTCSGITLEPTKGGARAKAWTELEPRGLLGKSVAHFYFRRKVETDMARALANLEDFLRGAAAAAFRELPRSAVNETALAAGLRQLRERGQTGDLLARLEGFLREAPDVELTHIRPLTLARKWQRDEWETLRIFLLAARCGLFDLSWETLCPNCRTTRLPHVATLAELSRISHCDVCQIKFDAEFDKSVELKFAVHAAVRPREERTFCLAGPGGKPHVVSQLGLEPGETRPWDWPRTSKPLRLYSAQVNPARFFNAGETAGRIECRAKGFDCAPGGKVEVSNPNAFPIQVSWEETDWSDEILTAARVTNWQEFQELFSREVISPSEQVTVGCQVILFTDLRGSTAMYSALGDAPAYALVRNHFGALIRAVSSNHGRVVKTIGDAVMASFSRVDEALAAARQSFDELPKANPGLASPLALKASLHVGPCLAVNANERLDFFGATVNLGARMVESCRGDDLTVSDELYRRPETAAFLQQWGCEPEPAEIQCRGIPTPQRIWRIRMVRP